MTPAMEIPTLVCVMSSPIHGRGLFAKRSIGGDERVIEYTGAMIDKAESWRRRKAGNEFIFELDAELDLDGNVAWNLARFINHSCAPNGRVELVQGRVWVVAGRDIAAGEEITFNYSYDLDDFEEHACHCGAPDCAGYIVAEELMPELLRRLERKSSARVTMSCV